MKTFLIYQQDNEHQCIATGVHWWCFMFAPFVLLRHQLWFETLLFFLCHILFAQMLEANWLDDNLYYLLQGLLYSVVAFTINDRIALRLHRAGYKLADIILAHSYDEAEYKFISNNMSKVLSA